MGHVGHVGVLGRHGIFVNAINNFATIVTEETFFDKHLPQKVAGGLDEICRFCDEFSFFCKKSNFFAILVAI